MSTKETPPDSEGSCEYTAQRRGQPTEGGPPDLVLSVVLSSIHSTETWTADNRWCSSFGIECSVIICPQYRGVDSRQKVVLRLWE
jgi:hypothetical protein